MTKILLHMQAKPLRWNKGVNPKNYPFRDRLVELLRTKYGEQCIIVEINSPIPLAESKQLIQEADLIICVDSYLGHLCWYMGKRAIVLFGQSDPIIFGHPENINLLKDRKYLRPQPQQHWLWEQAECNDDAFVAPEVVLQTIDTLGIK